VEAATMEPASRLIYAMPFELGEHTGHGEFISIACLPWPSHESQKPAKIWPVPLHAGQDINSMA
jgi:hypothetical protein